MKILVTGSSGFIGHHLVRYLKEQGHFVRGVDWEFNEKYSNLAHEFYHLDLRYSENAQKAVKGMDCIYMLAADMGGMGFIQDKNNQAKILYNNTMINFNCLEASRKEGIRKGFYSSSACAYPNNIQSKEEIISLKESDAYPADPQDTYGWEKLQMEHLVKSYNDCYNMDIKIGRFHNIYGPEGTFDGGREKAPAAFCRKVINAKQNDETKIDMWGNGNQVRSFCYIDDCLKAMDLMVNTDFNKYATFPQTKLDEPLNIGRDDGITINHLADLCMKIGEVMVEINHIDGPIGVKGRNSDNTKFEEYFGWTPSVPMEEGLTKTYEWIENQLQ